METELIEKQLEKVSPVIKRVFFSVPVAEEIAKIGEENGLLLDQIDDLIEETGYMVIGLKPSKDFITNIKNILKISERTASRIAEEIDTKVLKDVKEEIRKLNDAKEQQTPEPQISETTPPPPPINLLEKSGGIGVIRRPPSASPLYNDTDLKREAVLNDLENIGKLKPENASNFVEHLLSNPVSNPQQVEVKKPPTPQPPRNSGPDPYREPI